MYQIFCSTGALIGRPNGRNYRLLKEFCPRLECDGFEFLVYDSWYPELETLRDTLLSMRLNIPVIHCEKSLTEHFARGGEQEEQEGYRKFELNCGLARAIGAEKMVLHLWNGLISDSHIDNNMRAYPRLREIAERHGLELLVENVVCHTDPMSHWEELYRRYPDILFVYDTKMADFHRQMNLLYDAEHAWLWKEGHIRHYHVNDYGGGYMDWSNLKVLPIGQGHIDFDRFFAFVRETGYRGDFTFEATGFNREGQVDLDMLNSQFRRARAYIQGGHS